MMSKKILMALFCVASSISFSENTLPKNVQLPQIKAQEPQKREFLAYYRIWRDVAVKHDNPKVKGENWISMNDIPEGVTIVNVFGHDPYWEGDKENIPKLKEYFRKLKEEYMPELRKRGIKVVRGINYKRLIAVPKIDRLNEDDPPTDNEIEQWAKKLYEENVKALGIDGIDIDMEMRYRPGKVPKNEYDTLSDDKIDIGNKMIKALSKYLGPKSENKDKTMLIYDTNNSERYAVEGVKGYFDLIAYQQYGRTPSNTPLERFNGIFDKSNFMPGLTFPEEKAGFGSRFIDFHNGIYERSNLYKVAEYVKKNNLAGMFIYAIDRDSRTFNEPDYSTLVRSNFIWTKTIIQEMNGWTKEQSIDTAKHNLDRIKYYDNLSDEQIKEIVERMKKSDNLFNINKEILGWETEGEIKAKAINELYDPTLERSLMNIKIDHAKHELDSTKKLKEKDEQIKDSWKTLALALRGKRYTQNAIDEQVNIFKKLHLSIDKEIKLISDNTLSSIELTNGHDLNDRFSIAYTLVHKKNKFFNNLNAKGIIYNNLGLLGNIGVTKSDVNILGGTYYKLDTKIGSYIPSVGLVYALNTDDNIKTHFIAARLDNNFKFNAYNNNGVSVNPLINLNVEIGAYKSENTIFKMAYNHKVEAGVNVGYKIKNFNINGQLTAYNTLTYAKLLDKTIYDFGGSIDAKIGYDISPTSNISLNAGYSRTIKDNLYRAGIEFNKAF
ncbi:EndoS/ChiA family endoglycosidase [Oceanivirga salmonicida]|uniref:EndoS/ChiA family endoglycosidase n=1 Tax=Oceanivirga salmonicida TaxID=1769291 RepID=UPI0008313018|nr:hypothetical protein [Oceanivirga salmonicida]